MGAKEMAQSLRALTAIPEDLGSVPSTYMAAHNPWQFQWILDPSPFSGLCGHCMYVCGAQTYMQTKTKK